MTQGCPIPHQKSFVLLSFVWKNFQSKPQIQQESITNSTVRFSDLPFCCCAMHETLRLYNMLYMTNAKQKIDNQRPRRQHKDWCIEH